MSPLALQRVTRSLRAPVMGVSSLQDSGNAPKGAARATQRRRAGFPIQLGTMSRTLQGSRLWRGRVTGYRIDALPARERSTWIATEP
jgi:hypothetical protein